VNDPTLAIDAVSSLATAASPAVPAETHAPSGSFGQWFTNELNSVNAQLVGAERSVQQLAAGGAGSIHDTMIQLEQARMQFQLAIQVRGRVLEAYQEIMRMQV